MTRLQRQMADRTRCRRQRKAQKDQGRATQPRDPTPQGCRFLMDAHRMTATTSRFVLRINMGDASSRARLENGVHVDLINVTNKVATGTSRFTCATALTEARMVQFHRCRARANLFLLRFLLGEDPCPKLRFRQVFQF